jgi:hypothetical protein
MPKMVTNSSASLNCHTHAEFMQILFSKAKTFGGMLLALTEHWHSLILHSKNGQTTFPFSVDCKKPFMAILTVSLLYRVNTSSPNG